MTTTQDGNKQDDNKQDGGDQQEASSVDVSNIVEHSINLHYIILGEAVRRIYTAWWMKEIDRRARAVIRIFTVGVFLIAAISLSPIGRDDSDQGAWGARSGIAVRTDSLTGCQYLESSGGGLTPRVDRSGNHVGCR